jgi:type IV pilus assembly protein PilA
MIAVAIVGILAVLSINSVRRYLANAKSAEARNALGAIGKAAGRALERETVDSTVLGAGGSTVITHRLCQTSNFVPGGTSVSVPQGRKYQPNTAIGADYHFYDSAPNAQSMGWSCLKYEMTSPQSYCYHYISDATDTSTGTFMRTRARGDLNGDGITSRLTLEGAISGTGNALTLAPSLLEEKPDE